MKATPGPLALPRSYFERVYAEQTDPWGFATRWYEKRKYAISLAALPEASYRHGFEPGCAIGVLSEQLAGRCQALTCLEPMPKVAEEARRRLAPLSHAVVHEGGLPDAWPEGASFDLIVFSEVLYYLTESGFDAVMDRAEASLSPGGTLLAVHYRLETDYPLSGDAVHDRLARRVAQPSWALAPAGHYQEDAFVLDVYQRSEGGAPGPSGVPLSKERS